MRLLLPILLLFSAVIFIYGRTELPLPEAFYGRFTIVNFWDKFNALKGKGEQWMNTHFVTEIEFIKEGIPADGIPIFTLRMATPTERISLNNVTMRKDVYHRGFDNLEYKNDLHVTSKTLFQDISVSKGNQIYQYKNFQYFYFWKDILYMSVYDREENPKSYEFCYKRISH